MYKVAGQLDMAGGLVGYGSSDERNCIKYPTVGGIEVKVSLC